MCRRRKERVTIKRSVLTLTVIAVLTVSSDAPAGGISDEPCPNVAGENTNTCPAGTVGTPYSIRFRERDGAGCGQGRQTFHHDSGVLPPGLQLALDGTLRGTSFQPGTFRFYVEMREPIDDPTHCAGKRTQKQFTLTIRRQPWIVPSSAVTPRSEVGVPFRMAPRARGGSGIFAWSLVSGRLPAGLRIFADGSIAGTPRSPGTYSLTARARDTESRTLDWSTELSVAPRLRVRTLRLPPAHIARRYRAELATVGGIGPTIWKLTHGRLPRGIRLHSRLGRLTGTPTDAGRYVVTLEVRDRLKVVRTKSFRIVVGGKRRALAHEESAR
jgi:Putative Ig domain